MLNPYIEGWELRELMRKRAGIGLTDQSRAVVGPVS